MKKNRCLAAAAGVAALALLCTACEREETEPDAAQPAPTVGVSGRWSVRAEAWRRTMDLVQDGAGVSGTVIAPNGDTQSVRGTLNAARIALRSGDVTGSGTVAGATMQGTYERDNGDSGSWRAWRQP
ncbi:MAG: hypothetical protein FJ225_06570 [Lentisphaerae bacterium]|nr:hypothetical protein [Lentisphaerota bacterium]